MVFWTHKFWILLINIKMFLWILVKSIINRRLFCLHWMPQLTLVFILSMTCSWCSYMLHPEPLHHAGPGAGTKAKAMWLHAWAHSYAKRRWGIGHYKGLPLSPSIFHEDFFILFWRVQHSSKNKLFLRKVVGETEVKKTKKKVMKKEKTAVKRRAAPVWQTNLNCDWFLWKKVFLLFGACSCIFLMEDEHEGKYEYFFIQIYVNQ